MLCVKITGSWKRHPDNTFIYMRAGLNIAQRKGETAHHPWKGCLTPSHHYTSSHETLSCGSVVPPRKESLSSHPHTCQNPPKATQGKGSTTSVLAQGQPKVSRVVGSFKHSHSSAHLCEHLGLSESRGFVWVLLKAAFCWDLI